MKATPKPPSVEVGYKKLPDGRIVSNGCECEWRRQSTDAPGYWDARKCPVHRK